VLLIEEKKLKNHFILTELCTVVRIAIFLKISIKRVSKNCNNISIGLRDGRLSTVGRGVAKKGDGWLRLGEIGGKVGNAPKKYTENSIAARVRGR